MFKGLYDQRCTIGSTGFAQLGRPGYTEKQKFEGRWLHEWFSNNFILPESMFLAWTSHHHDFGTYYELEVFFSTIFMKEEEIEEQWELVNKLEDVDLEALEEKVKEDWLILRSAEAIEKDDGSHLNLVG